MKTTINNNSGEDIDHDSIEFVTKDDKTTLK